MIKYYCEHCKLKCEESSCHICGLRTKVTSEIYWCKNCNVPTYDRRCCVCGNKGNKIATDLRPVFPEERLLIEILIDKPFKFKNSSVWNTSGNRYIIDGIKLNLSIKELMQKKVEEVVSKLSELKGNNSYDNFHKYIEKFIKVNNKRYNLITTEAIDFILNQKQNYNYDEMFVSFSGGKDSTVVSDLVVKAFAKPEIIHVFGDTTLEFPMTIEYAKRFKRNNIRTPLLYAKNKEKNFYEMCNIIGPPSRIMRWCCVVFKTGAINKRISSTFKNKNRLLTFYGIRRNESNIRNKYERISDSPKITKQKVVSPIIDWFDFDIWLYLLTTKVDFNDAYRLGYSRVGCWCCPNNTQWAQYLSNIYMPEQSLKWRNQLITFARRVGKLDAEVYVDEGKWKARQGGNGVEYSKKTLVKFKPCVEENESINYELTKQISDDLYEFFKPFGWINKEMGSERLGQVYIVDKLGNPILRLQGRIGSKSLKVTVTNFYNKVKNLKEMKQKIDCQITKYQMCLGCLGCESVCKHDAIYIKSTSYKNESVCETVESYKISDKKCIRCGECINHFDGGCYMRRVLITKRGD